jgi:hypothetical protein
MQSTVKELFTFPLKEMVIYAEVVTGVASSLEAGGLSRYPKSVFVEINVMKS